MTQTRAPYSLTSLSSPLDCVTIEVTRKEAALIRRVRELIARNRDCFVVEITQTGFIWREVGKREG